jgi:hypothetical protein
MQSGELQKESTFVRWLIYVLSLGTGVLIIFTLRKVFGRWEKANSDMEVSLV